LKIDNVLLTTGARESSQRLLREHGIVFVWVRLLLHEHIKKILQLLLKHFKVLLCLCFISQLFSQSMNHVIQFVHQEFLKLCKSIEISLLIELILKLLEHINHLILEVIIVLNVFVQCPISVPSHSSSYRQLLTQ